MNTLPFCSIISADNSFIEWQGLPLNIIEYLISYMGLKEQTN